MAAFSLVLSVLALTQCCIAFSAYQRPVSSSYSSSYTASQQSSGYAPSAVTVSTSGAANCCQLSPWAYNHIEEVREFAQRLRQEYNSMSQGSTGYSTTIALPWHENMITLTGKTASELDALNRRLCEQLVTDMRKGILSYATIAQPSFFEWKAAETLEHYAHASGSDFGQQQQQTMELNHYQPVDLSHYDEVKNYAYPAEVKIIDGKTYLVHKNCTEATKTSGTGTYESPLVSVLKRNHTIFTDHYPQYGYLGLPGNYKEVAPASRPGVVYPSTTYIQPGGATTVTRKQTIYDWVNQNMEPSVANYKPVVSLDSEWSGNLNSYRPTFTQPSNADVETFATGNQVYRPSYSPGSTVTIRRYNKTVITNPDGTNSVQGSELNRKWVDGKLVYDTERPFGEWSVPRDEAWKREERERFFWFLTQSGTTPQQLEAWQRQQEERLLAMADRYHTTIEEIQEWHRKELERYRVLLGQYQAQNNDLTGWKRLERGRLDWLIHQNSVTREELERWQRENQDRLAQLAKSYRISVDELKNWQIEELNRLYVYFNDQNNSMISHNPHFNAESLRTSEQERLEELIRQHNATIEQLQSSIKLDQQKLLDLSQKYRGNVQDMEKWLKSELARLGGIINEQHTEMTRVTAWQHSERERLENIVKQHRGSVEDLESQMVRDRAYLQTLAAKYHVSIEELEKWQRTELTRLQNQGQSKLEQNIKEWQQREHDHLLSVIKKNDLTIEEFELKIMSDRARLEELAKTYKLQVSEVEDWIKNEIKKFQTQGLLKEVKEELALWQQKERDRLLAIVQQNRVTIEELETNIKKDQSHLYTLANTYQVRVEDIEEWLKKELLRLQSEGLIKVEDLKEWQQHERAEILKMVQLNKFTIEEFEQKLLADRQRLQDLSKTYNVQTTEIESWIKQEGERLQSLGLLQMQEQLNNWQKIERDRLLTLINTNNLSIDELEEKIKKDQVHLYSLAHQHQVRVEEIEEWIKKEIKKLQQEGLVEMEKLKDWQTEWRGNLTNMVKERDFTVEEFHKWLLEDRNRLQSLAMQHNIQIEDLEQWVRNEEQRFVSMGLLKPNEKLTNWQEVERRYLERITQEQYHSTEQLEQRLRQDRVLLEKLARDYSVQVEEIEKWMKKELARLRDDGQLQIDNLTSWQIAERERLEELIKQNKKWSVEEFEAVLRKDREHMQTMAFQYHTSVEEIEKWIQSEVARLRAQGKLNIEQLTAWQKTQQQRILNLLQQQSSITVEEFERKVQQDRRFLTTLANQYHISVVEVEEYVKKVIEELQEKGKFEVANLQTWQLVERDYIKQLIAQYNNDLTTTEYEQKLLADRAHLQQLAAQYRINIEQIERWMIEEVQRLRKDSENKVQQLAAWQVSEAQRLKELIKENNHLSYVQYEVELSKERARLQQLANQYSLSVEEIEQWLRQQLLNLRTTGQLQVENLTKWQDKEQQRLIGLLLQTENNLSYEQFEQQLQHDRARLQQLSEQYSVSVEKIESWMRDELQRLKNSGLLQVEQLNQWQTVERNRLQNWLKQQHNGATYEQFTDFLKRDKARLQRIAQDYHVTVEEVESWVQQEGARLQILGLVQRPEKIIYVDEQKNWQNNVDNMWKVHTRAHLQAIAQVRRMNWQDFERYLAEERPRWEQFARQYNITVENIEVWLRQSAQELAQQGLIHGSVTVEEWETKEQLHIQDLINAKLRKQQQWSSEELERQLKHDREHLQQLALKYHLTIEEIEIWYRNELQRLLNQRKIVSENLIDWQRREKERIYWIVMRQPAMSLQSLEQQLLQDKLTLNRLADEYHISIEELELWIRNELRRLNNLGLVQDSGTQIDLNKRWQQQERERLRTIVADITITEEELLEFIAADHGYQQQLTRIYGCTLEQLAPFQRIEAGVMQRERLFDTTKLLTLQAWQKRERDRLYNLIKNQNFSLKNLKDWQRQDIFLTELATKYGITLQTLKDWQLQEYERLLQLAENYQMSLKQLQDYREKEILYLTYVMHKKTKTEMERSQWAASEASRIELLEGKTGLSGAELLAWRRKLYLLCQGLLPMDFGGFGGHDVGIGSTNRTAAPQQIISKDRGDQPPNVYEETVDTDEPGVAGKQNPLYPPPAAAIREEPATQRPTQYLPPPISGSAVQSGYSYTKKEYKYTVPIGVATASASADATSSAASASIGDLSGRSRQRYGRERENEPVATDETTTKSQQEIQQEVDDFGQQQQEELDWTDQNSENVPAKLDASKPTGSQQQVQQEVDDFGQQQQEEELTWNGRLTADTTGQQQLQVEDISDQYAQKRGRQGQQQQQLQKELIDNGQQQVEVEVLDGTFATNAKQGLSQQQIAAPAKTVENVEVKAEAEPTGFWSKLKQKTTNIFG